LLNAQTGGMIDVEISPWPADVLEIDGKPVDVDAFRIISSDGEVDIKVYYARGGAEWLALESVLENGRTMRYQQADATKSAAKPGGAEGQNDRTDQR
jgi:hypothetical protein